MGRELLRKGLDRPGETFITFLLLKNRCIHVENPKDRILDVLGLFKKVGFLEKEGGRTGLTFLQIKKIGNIAL